jgi:DNA mismatch repair protein MutL
VTFALYSGERELLRFMKGEDLRVRLGKIWPDQLTGGLEAFELHRPGLRARGLAGLPSAAQPRADRMLFYVNGRTVNDRLLQRAAREAYKGRLLAREYPQLAFFLEIDPEEVDVNVHPAKTEVRFRDERAVFGAALRAVESALAARGPGFIDARSPGFMTGEEYAPAEARREEAGVLPLPPVIPPAALIDAVKGDERCPPGFWGEADRHLAGPRAFTLSFRPPLNESAPAEVPPSFAEPAFNEDFKRSVHEAAAPYEWAEEQTARFTAAGAAAPLALPGGLVYLGQVAGTYLLLLKDDKLLLLDQHAVHERVLMHRFTRESSSQAQFLALPLELTLHPAEHEALRGIWDDLTALGFSLGISGGTLRVTGLPAVLSRAEARDFLRGAMAGQGDSLRELLVMMSCKAAIKAGQKLTADEALGLIRQWLDTPEREYCPHGRPAVLALGAAELERMFKRRG